jgi:Zn-dependent alcohol dehydrogenase
MPSQEAADYCQLLESHGEDRYAEVGRVISARLSLDRVNEGFEGMKRGEVVRAVLDLRPI